MSGQEENGHYLVERLSCAAAAMWAGRASKLPNVVPRDEMPRLSVSPFDFQSNCPPD